MINPAEPREQRLVETFVELADTLVDDFDVVEIMHVLAERCVELLDVNEAGILLADPAGAPRVIASSSERTHVLELFQIQSDQGPCMQCIQTGHSVTSTNLNDDHDRWPEFAPAATAAGFASVHALPMHLRHETLGALNLFRQSPGPMNQVDLVAANAMADIATISLLHERTLRQAQVTVEQLQRALQSRIIIEQAKGILAEQTQLNMDEAFTRLRSYSRNHNRRLSDVAHDVVTGAVDHQQLAQSSSPQTGLNS